MKTSYTRMLSILRTAAITLLFLAVSLPANAQTPELPLEVRVDLVLVRLEKAIVDEDHPATLGMIEELRALDRTLATGEIYFIEARAAKEAGDIERADQALKLFLADVPRESDNYAAALEMVIELPELLKAAEAERLAAEKAEEEAKLRAEKIAEIARLRAEKNEELKRKREEEERILAQKEAEENARIEKEKALGLTPEEIYHIASVIYKKYDFESDPIYNITLMEEDRQYLSRYSVFKGFPETDTLNRELADAILAEPFEPIRNSYSWMDLKGTSGDWEYYTTANDCAIISHAKEVSKGEFYTLPVMFIWTSTFWSSDGGLDFNLLDKDYIFDPDLPVYANVDGTRFDLRIDYGKVKPDLINGDGSKEFTRALRDGTNVSIHGRSFLTGRDIRIDYSALGFTNAFRQMAGLCNNTKMLSIID